MADPFDKKDKKAGGARAALKRATFLKAAGVGALGAGLIGALFPELALAQARPAAVSGANYKVLAGAALSGAQQGAVASGDGSALHGYLVQAGFKRFGQGLGFDASVGSDSGRLVTIDYAHPDGRAAHLTVMSGTKGQKVMADIVAPPGAGVVGGRTYRVVNGSVHAVSDASLDPATRVLTVKNLLTGDTTRKQISPPPSRQGVTPDAYYPDCNPCISVAEYISQFIDCFLTPTLFCIFIGTILAGVWGIIAGVICAYIFWQLCYLVDWSCYATNACVEFGYCPQAVACGG